MVIARSPGEFTATTVRSLRPRFKVTYTRKFADFRPVAIYTDPQNTARATVAKNWAHDAILSEIREWAASGQNKYVCIMGPERWAQQ